jgi:hypothetical protein
MKRGQRLLRGSLRAGAGGLLVVIVMAAVLWGTFALWFALPAEAGARLIVKGQDLFPKGDWGITGVAITGPHRPRAAFGCR